MQREDNDSQELRRIIDGVFEYIDEQQLRHDSSTSNQPTGTLHSLYFTIHSQRHAAVRYR
jgi:hypothetical protein